MNINKFLCNYHIERYNNCNMKFLNFDYKDCTNPKDGYEINRLDEKPIKNQVKALNPERF